MGFQDCDSAAAESTFVKLEGDGDSTVILFVSEPKAVKKNSRFNREQQRFFFPVFEAGELKTLDANKETYLLIRDLPDSGQGRQYVMTRHGAKSSVETTYSFEEKPLTDAEKQWCIDNDIIRAKPVKAPSKAASGSALPADMLKSIGESPAATGGGAGTVSQ
jgi:hypothetical protein